MHPSQFPAGHIFGAGMFGIATVLPDCDFETYSEAGYCFDWARQRWHGPTDAPKGKSGLPVVGAAVYASHPTTEVLSFAYDLKDGIGPRRWRPDCAPPLDLFDHLQREGLVEGWNVGFEWWIWNYVCIRRYGWPPLRLEQTRCAMGKARAFGLPGKLELAGPIIDADVLKDKDGDRLLKKFSMPRQPTKGDKRLRVLPSDDPADFANLVNYNVTDIAAEADISARVPDLEGEELEFWIVDQRVNRRGVHIDRESLEACAFIVRQCLERYNAELCQLTGGVVEAASQLERLKGFLRSRGLFVREGPGAMDEEAIDAMLAIPNLDPVARRALELRQLVGSASVKKVFALLNTIAPWDRVHDLYNYHGARTGRPTGDGAQPTNLPKAGPNLWRCGCGNCTGMHRPACAWCGAPRAPEPRRVGWGPDTEATEEVLSVIRRRNLSLLEAAYGDAMLCVSGCLRGLFTAAPGCELIASDFSAIESVVTACLAGEPWRVDMFHTHGKNYEMSVSQIAGVPFSEVMAHAGYTDTTSPEWWKSRAFKGPHHPLRQTLGKVAELASGFGGWIPAWLAFDAGEFMSEDEIKRAILKWRDASPNIVEFWGGQERREYRFTRAEMYGLEGMAVSALLHRGREFPVLRKDGSHTGITYVADDSCLYCRLPSGRYLYYRNPVLEPNQRTYGGVWSISFEGYNTNPTMGPIGWVRMNTYGGKLCENVVQATARDIQRHAMNECERRGLGIVLHVYDEIVLEVPQGTATVADLEAIMGTMPAWATYGGKPWPIRAAGGWAGKRYRKD